MLVSNSPPPPFIGSQRKDHLLISSEGRTIIWPIVIAKEHLPFTLSELVSMKPVITHEMSKCITWRKRWNVYANVFIVELE